MTRVVAVDWSGRAKRPEESIWTAEVRDGRLVDLRNSRTGGQVVEWLGGVAEEEPRTVVGFDFAFSFPRWWCEEQGWVSGREVWAAMAKRGEAGGSAACGRSEPVLGASWSTEHAGRRAVVPPDGS